MIAVLLSPQNLRRREAKVRAIGMPKLLPGEGRGIEFEVPELAYKWGVKA